MLSRMRQRGVTLIELIIGLAIAGVLLVLALPNFTIFLQNTQIKNAAETTITGITLARTEAVRRNVAVRFQLVTNLTAACALSATSLSWVVSRDDATGLCNIAPHDTTPPRAIQSKSAQEGAGNVTVATVGGNTIMFNSLGRVSTAVPALTRIDLRNPTGGTCEHEDVVDGTMRCLRIEISSGGGARVCDPKITAASDPRKCT